MQSASISAEGFVKFDDTQGSQQLRSSALSATDDTTYLARFRVISEPAENRVRPKERHLRTESKRDIWRMQCGGECVEPGLEYPAPWHVAN